MATNPQLEKTAAQPIPAVVVYGPAGSGKTAMIDLMVKFFGVKRVEDGFTVPKNTGNGEGPNCRWTKLERGVLYITNEEFTSEDMIHAGLAHEVYITSIWDVFTDLGAAKGRTASSLYTDRAMNMILRDVLGLSERQRRR